jgi:beta-methylmalyl-CoA/(S)-malyl-CoA lyase
VDELREAVSKTERFTDAVVLDGQMVDEATFKNFANTVATVRAIAGHHPAQTDECYDTDLLDRARAVDLTAA